MCILEKGIRNAKRHPRSKRSLGVMAAVMLLYFNVSGGPIGAEPIISAAGPLVGLVGLCVFPFVWSIQISLMTAELSSAFPSNGGYSVWVTEAMGDLWGYQESYYSWLSGVTDNALYPGLIWGMIQPLLNVTGPNGTSFFPADDESDSDIFEAGLLSGGGLVKIGCKIFLGLVMVLPNFFLVGGLEKILVVIVVATVLPFFIFAGMCVPHMELSNLAEYNLTETAFAAMLQNMFWNLNGFDSISTAAGEVINPAVTISTSLWISIPLITLMLALPLMAAAGVNKPIPWKDWQAGQFTVIAQFIESSGALATCIGVAAAVGGCGLYITEMLEDSFQIHGMAECGMMPRCFQYRHKYFRTPMLAIALNLAFIIMLQFCNLQAIMTYTNVLNCASVLLELGAFFVLRYKRPKLRRKFRVAGPMWWLWILFSPSFALSLFVIGAGCLTSWQLAVPNLVALLLGFALYGCMKAARLKYVRQRSDTDELDDEDVPGIDFVAGGGVQVTPLPQVPGVILPNLAAEGEEVVVDPFLRAISGHNYAAPPRSSSEDSDGESMPIAAALTEGLLPNVLDIEDGDAEPTATSTEAASNQLQSDDQDVVKRASEQQEIIL